MNVSPFHDGETIRQQRNLTHSQKRNNNNTREGVLVNNFIKENELGLNNTKDTYIISDHVPMPQELYDDNKIVDKKLLPLSVIALGVMSSVAVLTAFVSHSAKVATNIAKEKLIILRLYCHVSLNFYFSI